MFYGTSHFVSESAAIRYYAAYENEPANAVATKIAEGSIHIGKPVLKGFESLRIIDNGMRYAINAPETIGNLWLTSLDPEQHQRTCNYWYTVTSHATSHTAFETLAGLSRWCSERGLRFDMDKLPERGFFASMPITGEYQRMAHMSYDEFYSLPHVVRETKVMDNGQYTLGRITEVDGIRCVHTLNPNCKHRPVFDYTVTSQEMR